MTEAILLIGSHAASKSVFYLERYYRTHVRITLDQLKTRQREEILIQACLMSRQPFCVDNTNTTKIDRARYITPAKSAGFRVTGYYFTTGQTIINVDLPRLEEGFSSLFYVRELVGGKFDISPWAENYTINLRLTEVEPLDGKDK
jgi:hypothetical protein